MNPRRPSSNFALSKAISARKWRPAKSCINLWVVVWMWTLKWVKHHFVNEEITIKTKFNKMRKHLKKTSISQKQEQHTEHILAFSNITMELWGRNLPITICVQVQLSRCCGQTFATPFFSSCLSRHDDHCSHDESLPTHTRLEPSFNGKRHR